MERLNKEPLTLDELRLCTCCRSECVINKLSGRADTRQGRKEQLPVTAGQVTFPGGVADGVDVTFAVGAEDVG